MKDLTKYFLKIFLTAILISPFFCAFGLYITLDSFDLSYYDIPLGYLIVLFVGLLIWSIPSWLILVFTVFKIIRSNRGQVYKKPLMVLSITLLTTLTIVIMFCWDTDLKLASGLPFISIGLSQLTSVLVYKIPPDNNIMT